MITGVAIRKDGKTHTMLAPARHHDVIRNMNAMGHHPAGGEQGFVDDKGNFLNRREAAAEALRLGQVKGGRLQSPPNLFSEDVW